MMFESMMVSNLRPLIDYDARNTNRSTWRSNS